LSFSSYPLSLIKMFFLRAKMIKIIKHRRKGNVKTFSLGLNVRPYNRLDKEVADFREYKGELIKLYNTKYSYLGTRIP